VKKSLQIGGILSLLLVYRGATTVAGGYQELIFAFIPPHPTIFGESMCAQWLIGWTSSMQD
jgi:hypothetical protein